MSCRLRYFLAEEFNVSVEEVDAFVPPLSSIKGVGKTAMDELTELRPFKSLKGFLYDDEGK